MEGSYLTALSTMLNGANTGNSFPGMVGGASTIGQTFNGGGAQPFGGPVQASSGGGSGTASSPYMMGQGMSGNGRGGGVDPALLASNPAMANLFNGNLQAAPNPDITQYNPSNNLLNSPAANQNYSQMNGVGLQGIAQALQSAMSQGGGTNQQIGGANLPQINLGSPDLQKSNPFMVQAPRFNPTQANIDNSQIKPQDSDFYNAVSQQLQRKFDAGKADIRSRFGASGGTSRGTPAAYAEAQYNAENLPALGQALGGIRQQEFTNQLAQRQLGQEGNLANAGMQNQYGLAGNQLSVNTQLQNESNILQGNNQNNAAALQTRAQNLDALGLGQEGTLQNQSLVNQAGLGQMGLGNDRLNSLSNLFLGNQGQQLQNYFNTIGANQNQLGIMGNLANQAGELNLGQNQLRGNIGMFNAGQNNNSLMQMMQQMQAANESQIGRQFGGMQNIMQIVAALAGAGIPGGSANVNLGGNSQSGLQQLMPLFAALGGM